MQTSTLAAALFTIAAMTGCATPAFVTNISPPPIAAGARLVPVTDDRAELQIGMTTVGIGGGGLNQLEPNPPLAKALQAHLAAQPNIQALASVRVERLDLKARVGFAAVNDLTCEIESWATFVGEPSPRRIRTVARNNSDFSSRPGSMGEAILPDCLAKHAADIGRGK